ncbi:hypothetical protein [Paucibacter sp. M5-1]|uniref:hypothetical protein n=1 Tax=Paucibacter sp. M5-1 TaxID=3015998 RepID=UPI0022B87D97|nr:hypothetical protein [Paucibacter sp. M5-1]MCZ7883794.1 hypothetical protein [Paucibacter sp. M5-1]
MQIATPIHAQARLSTYNEDLPQPLELISTPTVDTATAARFLNRRPQTLRGWACNEDGPVRCIRINGRLAWPVADLRRVLGVAA